MQEPEEKLSIRMVLSTLWTPHRPGFYVPMESTILWLASFLIAPIAVVVYFTHSLEVLGLAYSGDGNKRNDWLFEPFVATVIALYFVRILSFKVPKSLYQYKHTNAGGQACLSPRAFVIYWLLVALIMLSKVCSHLAKYL